MRKIRKDDLVVVIAGKDKDKQGKVISVDTKKNKVLVQGCNMVTKHTKQSPANPQGLAQVFDPENIGIIGKHFDFFLLFHTKSPFSMLNWLFQALIVC